MALFGPPKVIGDPFVLRHEGNYYLFGNNAPDGFRHSLSKDLGHIPEKYTQGAALWRSRDRIAPLPMSGLPGPVQILAKYGEG